MHHAAMWDGRSQGRPPVAYAMDAAEAPRQATDARQAEAGYGQRQPLPNYLVGALIVLLLAVMIFAAQTFYWKGQVDVEIKRIEELKALIDELKIYNQHTREQFALHGWSIDSQGNIKNINQPLK